jgi:sporulation protein YlmC with PRC-barrel domain
MLWNIKSLSGYKILAKDGEIGKVKDFLFDDESWLVNYLVVDTGNWLINRKVLIVPTVIDQPEWESKLFPVTLTREQVENSPDIGTDQPISRQHQIQLHDYYAWPYYWTMGGSYTPYIPYSFIAPTPSSPEPAKDSLSASDHEANPHLRSTQEIIGYHIQATDGELGHVENFIADDEVWVIRYIVVDTRNWLPSRKVLIPVPWIEDITWADRKVSVHLSREKIQHSPEHNLSAPVDREYEMRFYDYYGRPKYWE